MPSIHIIAATPALRAGLAALLTGDDHRVAGTAASLREPLPQADVLLLADAALLDAADVIDTARYAILVLSADARPIAAMRRLPVRSWGIALPDAAPAELRAAVSAVAQGLIVVPATLNEAFANAPTTLGSEPLDEPLTARENEVLQLLAEGLPNKQIARRLSISEHTVKFHVSAVYAKLNAASRTDAVSKGARRGLITL